MQIRLKPHHLSQLFLRLSLGFIKGMGIDIQCGTGLGVTKQSCNGADIHALGNEQAGVGMPLRYNYDKPEKPRRIKGFEVFSLVFSSFFKPKNHTERSRIAGGVSLTTNE